MMTTMNNEDPADPSVHEPRVLDAAQEARLEDHDALRDASAEQHAADAEEAAANLAHKMARAAGPQTARVMAQACYMLLCTAALVTDPDGYFEWMDRRDAASVFKGAKVTPNLE